MRAYPPSHAPHPGTNCPGISMENIENKGATSGSISGGDHLRHLVDEDYMPLNQGDGASATASSTDCGSALSPLALSFTPVGAPNSVMDAINFQTPSMSAHRRPLPAHRPILGYQSTQNSAPSSTQLRDSGQILCALAPHVPLQKLPRQDTKQARKEDGLAAEVQGLKELCNSLTVQLASQQEEIMKQASKQTACPIADVKGQEQAKSLDHSFATCIEEYVRASRALSGSKAEVRDSAVADMGSHGESAMAGRVSEIQKSQDVTITAVLGQVGTLDRLLQAISDAHNRRFEGLERTVSDQTKTIEDFLSDRRNMKSEIAELQLDRAQARKEAKDLSEKLDAATAKIEAHEKFQEQARKEAKGWCTEIDRLDDLRIHEAMRFDDQLSKITGDVVELQDGAHVVAAKVDEMKKEAEQQVRHRDNTLAQLRSEIKEMDKIAGEAFGAGDARDNELRAKIDELEASVSLQASQPAYDSFDSFSAVGVATSAALSDLRTELRELAGRFDATEGSTRSATADTSSLGRGLAALSAKVEALKNSSVSGDEFRNSREVVSNTLMDLERQVEEVGTRVDEVKSTGRDLAALRNKTGTLAQSCNDIGAKLYSLTQSVDCLLKDGDTTTGAFARLTIESDKMDKRLTALEGAIQASPETSKLTDELAKLETARKNVEDKLSELDAFHHRLQASRNDAQADDSLIATQLDKDIKRVDSENLSAIKSVEATIHNEVRKLNRRIDVMAERHAEDATSEGGSPNFRSSSLRSGHHEAANPTNQGDRPSTSDSGQRAADAASMQGFARVGGRGGRGGGLLALAMPPRGRGRGNYVSPRESWT